MNDRIRGIAFVAAGAVAWSTGGLIQRFIETHDTWTTIFWRSLSAVAFLLLFMAVTEGRDFARQFRRMGRAGVLVGVLFAVSSMSLVLALSMTSVAKTLVIVSATPLIAALLARVFLREAITPATWAAIAAVMVGIVIMVWGNETEGSLLGDFFALVMATAYAAAIVASRSQPEIRMTPASVLGGAIAMAVALPLAGNPLAVTAHDLSLMVLFGVGQLGLGMALFVTGVRLIPAALSALVAMLEPILGPVWVWLALGEQPGTAVLVGGTIVILSIVAKTVVDARREPRELPPAA